LPWAVAALATVIAAVSFLLPGSTEPPPLRRWTITLPDSAPLDPVRSGNLGVGQPALVLSPDQETLVYVAGVGRNGMLYKRPLDGLKALPVAGTEGANNPFFSPDGQWIAFFAGRELKKVPISGGMPQLICEATNAYGGCWTSDGKIIFSYKEGSMLGQVSPSGGKPTVLAWSKERNREFRWPQLLPSERHLLVSAWSSVNTISLETGEKKVVLPDALFPRYLPGGRLLYTRGGAVEVIPFDVENLAVTGKPIQAIIGVRIETRGPAQYVCTDDGTLIYAPGLSETRTDLVTLDRDGKESPLPFPPDVYGTYKYSPDGSRVAISIERTARSVYVFDLVRASRTNLTPGGSDHWYPIWTPDGSWVTFASEEDGVWNVFRKRADGWGDTERLTEGDEMQIPYSWSPDGEHLLVTEQARESGSSIVLILPELGADRQVFEKTENAEWGPAFSPDGRWVAYTSDEEGQYEIYVKPYPQTGQRWRISTEGGEEPVWSPTRDEIYYRFGREWMVVEYEDSPDFIPGPPRVLFEGDYINVAGRSYDISPDGERFLLLKRHGKAEKLTRLNVVTNWFGELDRLAQE
jgi:serine/threonine-protein kinase